MVLLGQVCFDVVTCLTFFTEKFGNDDQKSVFRRKFVAFCQKLHVKEIYYQPFISISGTSFVQK